VLVETLNPAQSINQSIEHSCNNSIIKLLCNDLAKKNQKFANMRFPVDG